MGERLISSMDMVWWTETLFVPNLHGVWHECTSVQVDKPNKREEMKLEKQNYKGENNEISQ